MSDSDTAVNDFEYARRVKHDLLAKGSEALDDMMEVARSTEHPRAYEVLSNMMKNVGEVSDSLLAVEIDNSLANTIKDGLSPATREPIRFTGLFVTFIEAHVIQ
mgnify:CR=1 FL=1